jgi:GNAT superfamily N-acetyltransferase
MCLYNFYAWPLSQRPRVAQILVLPPFQGAGIGKEMLRAAYELAKERDAVDLTVSSYFISKHNGDIIFAARCHAHLCVYASGGHCTSSLGSRCLHESLRC